MPMIWKSEIPKLFPMTTTTTVPAWLAERQQAARKRFETIPAPKRGDEAWRFASIKQLDFTNLTGKSLPADPADLISRSAGLDAPAAKFVFFNDQTILVESSLAPSVVCMPLEKAFETHSELVQRHFMKQETRLGSVKYAALHEASVRNGVFVHLPENEIIDGTIEIHHWISGGVTVFPHLLVVTERSAKVRVVEIFRSADTETAGLAVAFNDLCAGQDSTLDYVAIQDLNEVSRMISINETSTARNARARGFVLNTGAAWVRNESLSRLEGPGAHSDMLSVSIPDREQEYDQRTFQHHVSEGAYSDLLYKNTLYGHAKTVFSGLIFVDEKAHHTDAYQTCRNLLMTDDCEANSMPGLEINADQVKCSHGSTTAQVSDEEIFYLQARGIRADQARQLIARGFSVEVVERLENSEVEALVLNYMERKFSRIAKV
jgi:Fe-S cluster assembly protein SufD